MRFVIMKPFYYYLLLLMLSAVPHAEAQNEPRPGYNDAEISISFGLLSHYQVLGILKGPLMAYMDMPSGMTGATFITYKQFITPRFSCGFTMGLDNQGGKLSYGNPKTSSYSLSYADYGSSGNYKRRAYTAGAECTYIYDDDGSVMHYGSLGIGYTYSYEEYTFSKDLTNPGYFYGTKGLVPTNPYREERLQFTGQVTVYGICRSGQRAHVCVEFGYGYKGMINAGVGYRLGKKQVRRS